MADPNRHTSSDHPELSGDIVAACADLVGRAGAREFQIGYLHDDVPDEEAGWYAHAQYRGTRVTAEDHRSPSGAALALAERLLRGAACRCGQRVTLADGVDGCRWRLASARRHRPVGAVDVGCGRERRGSPEATSRPVPATVGGRRRHVDGHPAGGGRRGVRRGRPGEAAQGAASGGRSRRGMDRGDRPARGATAPAVGSTTSSQRATSRDPGRGALAFAQVNAGARPGC